jgi:mycoredoxin
VLTIYTTSHCRFCRRLRTNLDRAGIPYTDVDVEQDAAAADFVTSVNGGNRITPTVRFADGTTLTNPTLAEVKKQLAA